MINVFIVLLVASIASILIPIRYGIIKYKAFSYQLKALFIYLCISLITELTSLILISAKQQVLPLQFSFCLFEFGIILYLFWQELNKKTYHIIITSLAIIYVAALGVSYYQKQDVGVLSDFSGVIGSVMIIGLTLLFFFKVLTDLQIPKLTDYPFFWLNSAFLMYFGTTFFLFLFNNAIKEFDQPIVYFLTGIHHTVNISYNILIAIALCKVKKR